MEKPNIHFAKELAELLEPLEQLQGRKLKLIIHAGTPKTGTTSLQTYLDKRQRKLRGKGILTRTTLKSFSIQQRQSTNGLRRT